MSNERNFEMKVRRMARKKGMYITKSRQQLHSDNKGEFMLVDSWSNTVIDGDKYDRSLQWILDYLKEKPDVRW